MRRLAYFALVVACGSCRGWESPAFEKETTAANITIANFRGQCGGAVGEGADFTVAEDVVIAGRVVSTDRAGNFHNSFFIDDGTGGVEIMAGMADLAAAFRPGQRVSVRVRGLAVGWWEGAMRLGLPPEAGSGFSTGYFYHPAVMRGWVAAEYDVEPLAPLTVDIRQLTAAMSGRLVRIEGLRAELPAEGATWAVKDPSPLVGRVKFRSSPTDSIVVVTSGWAHFASSQVPRGRVSLTGILLWGKGGHSKKHYQLRLRDEKDVDL